MAGDRLFTGGCSCGAVRYTAEISTDDAYLCHCRMCQRATGNVSVALVGLLKSGRRWTAGGPAWYDSSPIARRPFCSDCGTPLGCEYHDSPKCDVTVASLDQPGGFRPVAHFGVESMHPAWIDTSGLRRDRADEYAPLTQRWMTAIGKLPD